MTCIVGVAYPGGVVLSADSLSSSTQVGLTTHTPKVFQRVLYERHHGKPPEKPATLRMLCGFTTSWRMGQLVQYVDPYVFALPYEGCDDEALTAWMVNVYAAHVRKALEDGGALVKENEKVSGINMLVGVRGELYEMQDDFSFLRNSCGFAACGSGYEYALGALHAYSGGHHAADEQQAREWASQAVSAACEFCPSVGGVVCTHVLSDEEDTDE